MPADEGRALYDAAVTYLGDGVGVEIGTYCGKSTVMLGAAAQQTGGVALHRSTTTTAPRNTKPGWEYHDTSMVDAGHRPVRHAADAAPHARRRRTRRPRRRRRRQVVRRRRGRGERRCGSCSSTAGTPTRPRSRTSTAGRGGSTVGGALVIHDVFPNPDDGGQAPYHIYQRALDTGAFREVSATGSMRMLERTPERPAKPCANLARSDLEQGIFRHLHLLHARHVDSDDDLAPVGVSVTLDRVGDAEVGHRVIADRRRLGGESLRGTRRTGPRRHVVEELLNKRLPVTRIELAANGSHQRGAPLARPRRPSADGTAGWSPGGRRTDQPLPGRCSWRQPYWPTHSWRTAQAARRSARSRNSARQSRREPSADHRDAL